MPHDSAPAPASIPLPLGLPAMPARAAATGDERPAAPLGGPGPAPVERTGGAAERSDAGGERSDDLITGLVRAVTPVAVPVLDLGLPDARIADFLAGIAHADTGFVARTESGERALAVLAGTAAALCGMDIRAALAAPDVTFLRGLRPAAVRAVREVLLAVESDSPESVTRGVAVLTAGPGAGAAPRPDPPRGQ